MDKTHQTKICSLLLDIHSELYILVRLCTCFTSATCRSRTTLEHILQAYVVQVNWMNFRTVKARVSFYFQWFARHPQKISFEISEDQSGTLKEWFAATKGENVWPTLIWLLWVTISSKAVDVLVVVAVAIAVVVAVVAVVPVVLISVAVLFIMFLSILFSLLFHVQYRSWMREIW